MVTPRPFGQATVERMRFSACTIVPRTPGGEDPGLCPERLLALAVATRLLQFHTINEQGSKNPTVFFLLAIPYGTSAFIDELLAECSAKDRHR